MVARCSTGSPSAAPTAWSISADHSQRANPIRVPSEARITMIPNGSDDLTLPIESTRTNCARGSTFGVAQAVDW